MVVVWSLTLNRTRSTPTYQLRLCWLRTGFKFISMFLINMESKRNQQWFKKRNRALLVNLRTLSKGSCQWQRMTVWKDLCQIKKLIRWLPLSLRMMVSASWALVNSSLSSKDKRSKPRRPQSLRLNVLLENCWVPPLPLRLKETYLKCPSISKSYYWRRRKSRSSSNI